MIHKIKIKGGNRLAYIIAFILGLALLPMAIHATYIQRGYAATGGEYLIPVLFVGVVWIWKGLIRLWKEAVG